jgi:hypothetical protein
MLTSCQLYRVFWVSERVPRVTCRLIEPNGLILAGDGVDEEGKDRGLSCGTPLLVMDKIKGKSGPK